MREFAIQSMQSIHAHATHVCIKSSKYGTPPPGRLRAGNPPYRKQILAYERARTNVDVDDAPAAHPSVRARTDPIALASNISICKRVLGARVRASACA